MGSLLQGILKKRSEQKVVVLWLTKFTEYDLHSYESLLKNKGIQKHYLNIDMSCFFGNANLLGMTCFYVSMISNYFSQELNFLHHIKITFT